MSRDAALLIGTHTYAASGSAAERQQRGLETLRQLRRAVIVNVQFADGGHHVDGVDTLAVLRKDSRTVARATATRKPVLSEIFDAVAQQAEARGLRYICFTNADILWSQAAVDWILDGGKQGCALSRRDFDGETGADLGVQLTGVDALAIDVRWWRANRHRFRDYIAGEYCWDNVYTAIVMCHASAAIENRSGLLRHERHPSGASPDAATGRYIQLLTALDAWYFHLWCYYWGRLETLRTTGASLQAEEDLARSAFSRRQPVLQRILQTARSARARLRYALSSHAIQ